MPFFFTLVKNPRCARELICRIFLHLLKYNGFIINLLKDSHYVIYNIDNIYFFFEYDLLLLVSTSFSTLTVSLEVLLTYIYVSKELGEIYVIYIIRYFRFGLNKIFCRA